MMNQARAAFNSGRTRNFHFRKQQLQALLCMYRENKQAMADALYKDLRKSRMEACLTELEFMHNDLKYILDHLSEWIKPILPRRSWANFLDKLKIVHEPYGVVLIIGAWNYPFKLVLLPLHGAIASGNCAVIKPSEVAPTCAKLMAILLRKYLDNDCFPVYTGGVSKTTGLLKERFDYIFYTGSVKAAKVVHEAANKHLTPVTLELGGKNPVYLDDVVIDLNIATKRILWGKFINCGQHCLAPDYILCSKQMQEKFITQAKEVLRGFYGASIKKSPDLCRIVNELQFRRINALLKNMNIAYGGKSDLSQRFIEPTIVVNVDPADPIMQYEISGPLLPIVNVKSAKEAMLFITEKKREKPLIFYIFSDDREIVRQLITTVSAGTIAVNDTVTHLYVNELPFGGVGISGMGSYHGKASFNTFTHQKSILTKSLGYIREKMTEKRYPPYAETDENLKPVSITKWNYKVAIPTQYVSYFIVFTIGMAVTFLFISLFA